MGSRDQRRIQGPDKTTPFSIFQERVPRKFINDDNTRQDGRSAVEVQNIFMAVDIISQAKGSSFIEIGETKLVCGIYGPREVYRGDFKLTGQVSCEVKFSPFATATRRSPQPDRKQKELSRQLKEALEAVIILEKFPKAQIDVCITVVEDGGSLLSACITAAGLALCHGSIDAYDLVVGASVIWMQGVAYVDPTRHEEECLSDAQRLLDSEGDGYLTLGMMPKYAKGQVTLMVQEGELAVDSITEGIALATETCQKIYALARQTLLTHVEKALQKSPTSEIETISQ